MMCYDECFIDKMPEDVLREIVVWADSDTLLSWRGICRKFLRVVFDEGTIQFLIKHNPKMKKFYTVDDFSGITMSFWNYIDVYNSTFLSRYNKLYYHTKQLLYEAALRSGDVKMLEKVNPLICYADCGWEDAIRSDNLEVIKAKADHYRLLIPSQHEKSIRCMLIFVRKTTSAQVIDYIRGEIDNLEEEAYGDNIVYKVALDIMSKRLNHQGLDLSKITPRLAPTIVGFFNFEIMGAILSKFNSIDEKDTLQHLIWSLKNGVSIVVVTMACIMNRQPYICEQILLKVRVSFTDLWDKVGVKLIKYHEVDIEHMKIYHLLSGKYADDNHQIYKDKILRLLMFGRRHQFTIYFIENWAPPEKMETLLSWSIGASNFVISRWLKDQIKNFEHDVNLPFIRGSAPMAIKRIFHKNSHRLTPTKLIEIALCNVGTMHRNADAVHLEYIFDRLSEKKNYEFLNWEVIYSVYYETLKAEGDPDKLFKIGNCLRHFHQIFDPIGAAIKWNYAPVKFLC